MLHSSGICFIEEYQWHALIRTLPGNSDEEKSSKSETHKCLIKMSSKNHNTEHIINQERLVYGANSIAFHCSLFQSELSQMLQVLSEKAKAETQFIQQLKAMADRIPVSTHLVLLLLQALSEKAEVETQFIQQLKAMAGGIPVSTHLVCYRCYKLSQRRPR